MEASTDPSLQSPPATQSPPAAYETCDQCEAPVESNQRYCVVCGTRRKHVHDPAAKFLSVATSRNRTTAGPSRSARGQRGPSLATALLLALIPVAVAVGLLVGRSGNGQDAKLLAALRAQKPEVINIGSGGAANSSASTPAPAALTSDFTLAGGYAVELRTLAPGSTQATVTAAEDAARSKGATAVGLISQSDFAVTPKPPSGDYVIYSGQFKSRAGAERALTKLSKAFPSARVIAVAGRVSSGGTGAVLNKTVYGSFHSVSGIKPPSSSQLAQGAQITKRVASQINSNYVQSQKGLPNQISVP